MGNDSEREVRVGGMVASYTLHLAEGYIEEVFEGELSFEGVALLLQKVLADPGFHSGLNGLVDLRRATTHLGFDQLREIAQSLNEDTRASRGRWAFVVSNDLGHGIVRMFENMSDDNVSMQIFRSLDEALGWLVPQRS